MRIMNAKILQNPKMDNKKMCDNSDSLFLRSSAEIILVLSHKLMRSFQLKRLTGSTVTKSKTSSHSA